MSDKVEILLVDDEERFIDSLLSLLDHYNYSCTKAYTGSEAKLLLQRKNFEVALLDVGLPDMSGCDIAEFITTSCPDTCAIMLTGINTVDTAINDGQPELLSNQYHKMLPTLKILELTELEERLKALINSLGANPESPELKFMSQNLISDCETKLEEIQDELDLIEKIKI